MTVYVLHLEPPYKHAGHYIGYTPDESAERRIGEHLAGKGKGSPLIAAALRAGSKIQVAHVFEGSAAGRDFEANLKARRDTRSWCGCCGVGTKRLPDPARITERFRAAKVQRTPS